MAGAQLGMAVFFDKKLRAAEPAAKKFVELFAYQGHVFAVHLAQGLVLRLEFHQVVETVGQGTDAGCAAKRLVHVWGLSVWIITGFILRRRIQASMLTLHNGRLKVSDGLWRFSGF